jgi:flagellar motor switch protein FliM
VQIAPASETAAVVFFEIILHDQAYPFNLCFPYFVLEPLIQNLTSQSWALTQKKTTKVDQFHAETRMKLTGLPLVVQLNSSNIKLKDFTNLQNGDILEMNMKQGQELPVYVGNRVKFFCKPGVAGKKKVIKIVRSVTPQEEIIYE